MAPLANFRGLRKQLALAARGGQRRTLYELSKALGRRPGDVQRAVRQMWAEGLLKADEVEPGRGTHYWFNEIDFGDALDAALESEQPPGQLNEGQRVLVLSRPNQANPYPVLERGDLNGIVSWVAEWGDNGDLLVGTSNEANLRSVEQLAIALGEAGVDCVHRKVGELMPADAFRRHVAAVEVAKETKEATTV